MSLEAKIKFASMKLGPRVMSGADVVALTLIYNDLQINGNIRTPYFGVHGGADLDLNDAWAKASRVIGAVNRGEPNPLPEDNFSKTLVDIINYLKQEHHLELNPLSVVYATNEEVAGLMGIGNSKAARGENVGIIFGTSGPGETNELTALGEAWADSVPLMAIWGQVSLKSKGRGFQEGPGLQMSKPVAKYSVSVRNPYKLAEEVIKAYYFARAGRPGPTVVEIPKDVAQKRIEFDVADLDRLWSKEYRLTTSSVMSKKSRFLGREYHKNIDHAAEILSEGEQSFSLAGGSLLNSGPEAVGLFFELMKKTGIPFGSALMGLGISQFYDGQVNEDQFLGMVGMHGKYASTMALYNAREVVSFARLDDRVVGSVREFKRNRKKVIQVDIDPEELGRRMKVTPLLGDVRQVLEDLLRSIEPSGNHEKWWAQIREWRGNDPVKYNQSETDMILPQYLIETAMNLIPPASVISAGVGAAQMWVAQNAKLSGRHIYLWSGGFGTMGHGLPAAEGAWYAHPDKQVWDLDGDGSLLMTIQALQTASQYHIPVKIIIPVDGYRIVGQWQRLMYGGRTDGSVFPSPDFAKIAEGFGVEGINVTRKEQVVSTLEYMREKKRTVLGAFYVDPEPFIVPWVLAGKGPSTGMILKQP